MLTSALDLCIAAFENSMESTRVSLRLWPAHLQKLVES
jgi:hypothetical protein